MGRKVKTVYVCTQCGAIHFRWQGQCRSCSEWNTLVEERLVKPPHKAEVPVKELPRSLSAFDNDDLIGHKSGIGEFDRVLGGALLPGSSVLLAGEPGIGKSTLTLQAAEAYSQGGLRILYISGEESPGQLKKRAARLQLSGERIMIISLTDLRQILSIMDQEDYSVIIVDSIQTVDSSASISPPGTIPHIREAAVGLIDSAKQNEQAVIMVGHVTKEGQVAGPKLLEHMVDAVVYFEGDHRHIYRILRAVKNRFGPTPELGVFEMTSAGLKEVANPSQLFLSEFDDFPRTGAAVAASCEGNRSIMVEIQALVSPASYGTPQRVAGGIDNKRLALLLAIMEKRGGLPMGGNDVFVSIAGGINLREPAIDLAVIAAIASSLRDVPIDPKTALVGEVGLSGEIRPVGMIEQRVTEAAKLGFERVMVPVQKYEKPEKEKIEIVKVRTIDRLFEELF